MGHEILSTGHITNINTEEYSKAIGRTTIAAYIMSAYKHLQMAITTNAFSSNHPQDVGVASAGAIMSAAAVAVARLPFGPHVATFKPAIMEA